MLTLGQIKKSSVATVASCNVNDPQFTLYVNDAVRQLMDLGNGGSRGWWGTVQAITGVAYDGCFVWPSNVIAVLGMKSYLGEIVVQNQWYSFIPPDDRHQEWARSFRGHSTCEFIGQTCLFKSIASAPVILMAIGENVADIGKQITVYGTDVNGATTIDVLTIGSTNTTNTALATVTDVQKSATAGRIKMCAYSPATGIGETLAIYDGGSVNPKFLYSGIRQGSMTRMPITALVKIGYSEVSADTDIIPLDNIDAIKSQVQAIKVRESGNNGDGFERDALRRLVNQVNSRFPLEQFTVKFLPFGKEDYYGHKLRTY
jgi:hypothetical protein